MPRTILLLWVFCSVMPHFLNAQVQTTHPKDQSGLELQAYPAGWIAALNHEHFVSQTTSWQFRLGANFTDRQDFSSENDAEKGWGIGGSAGYRKYLATNHNGWVFGLHTDVWNLWVDWKNAPTSSRPISGSTFIVVLQPWVETGYVFVPKSSNSRIGLSVGLGREFNMVTNGRNVAQDWIGSLILRYQFAL